MLNSKIKLLICFVVLFFPGCMVFNYNYIKTEGNFKFKNIYIKSLKIKGNLFNEVYEDNLKLFLLHSFIKNDLNVLNKNIFLNNKCESKRDPTDNIHIGGDTNDFSKFNNALNLDIILNISKPDVLSHKKRIYNLSISGFINSKNILNCEYIFRSPYNYAEGKTQKFFNKAMLKLKKIINN